MEAAHLDRLDSTADAFRMTVIHCQHDGIENSPEVLFDGFGHFL